MKSIERFQTSGVNNLELNEEKIDLRLRKTFRVKLEFGWQITSVILKFPTVFQQTLSGS